MRNIIHTIKEKGQLPFLLLFFTLFSLNNIWAEGSKDLYPNGATGGRAYLRTSTDASLAFPFPNLGTHYVYAKAGEQISLASNAQSGPNKRIYLYSPTGADVTPAASGGAGNIPNRNGELAGPRLPGQGTGGNRYAALYYTVPVGGDGIYKVEFRGTNNNTTGDARLPYSSADSWPTIPNNTTYNYLIAWDISVAKQTGGTWAWQNGRVYTQVLNMDNPSYQSSGNINVFRANSGFYGKFKVLTRDGYVYNVNNNGNQGISFTFMVNNRGFHAVGDVNTPSYQSIAAPNAGAVTSRYHDPRTADNAAAVTQKIFYNLPDGTMPESATGAVPGNTTWLRIPEKQLDITDVKVTGVEGTPGVVGHKGAYIEFTNESGGDYYITIKPKAGSGNTFPQRLFSGQSNIGLNKIFWDGKDGAGNALPAGASEVDIELNIRGAEVHFPYIDMELNHNGIVIELLNTDLQSVKSDKVYWDDSAIRTVTTNTFGAMTNPRNASHTAIPNGTSSNTNGHIWGTGSNRAAGTFGDEQGMDTWTFIEGDKVTIDFNAEVKIADLYTEIAYTINGQPNPSSAKPGDAIVLTVKAGNNGPSDVIADHANGINGALFTFELPAGVDVSSVTTNVVCANATAVEEVSLDFDAATRMYRSELSLPNGCYIEYTFTGTLNGVNGAMVPEATIMRPADVTDPDATNPDELAPTNPHYECYNNDEGQLPGGAGSIGCNNITEVSFLILDDCIDEVLYYEDFDRGYWATNDGRTDWSNRSSISILNGAIQTDTNGNILRNGPLGGATPVYLFAPGQNDSHYTLANGSPHSPTVSVARIKNGYYAVLPPGYVQMGIPTTDSWSVGLWDPNAPTNDPTIANSNYDWTPAWDKANTIRDMSGAVNGSAFLVRGNNASNNSVKPFYEFDLSTTVEKDKVYSLNLFSYVTYHNKDYMLMDVVDNVTGHIYATVPLKYPGPGLPPGASPEGFSLGWVPLQASFSFSEDDCAVLGEDLDIKIAIRGSHDPLLDVGKGFGHTLLDNIMFTSEKVGQGCATNVAGITCSDDCYRDINGEGFEWRHEEGELANGTVLTQTFNQQGSDGGFVLDIYKLDNSFNMNINGVDLFDEEIEFQVGNPGNSGGTTLVQNIRFKSDGAKWGTGALGGIWTINADSTIDLDDRTNNPTPAIRVIIDRWGNAKMYGKRSTAAPLEELELFDKVNPTTVKYLSQVLWNEDATNTIEVNQLVVGTTAMSGFGYGQEYKECETCELDKEGVFVDGNNNGFSEVGEQIKYTFDVRNLGDMEIHDIEITDPLLGTNIKVIQDGNGDWVTNRADVTFTGDTANFGVLDQNETWTFTVNYSVTNTDVFTNKGVYNRATVTGTGRVFNSDNERNVEVESKDPTPYVDGDTGWDSERPFHTYVSLKGGGVLITNPMIYQRTR